MSPVPSTSDRPPRRTSATESRSRRRSASPRATLGAVLALTLVLSACSSSGHAAADTTSSSTTSRSSTSTPTTSGGGQTGPGGVDIKVPTLVWKDCDGGYQCATIKVPLDYSKPHGRKETLALARRVARKPSERIGSLLMNPGGPGASAIDLIESSPLPSSITDHFDIVGLDPRGVGRSTPLNCRTYLAPMYDTDPTIDNGAERAAYLAISKQFVDQCATRYRRSLPFMGTVNVARDMDIVRAALGDAKLSYVGYSYGTSIGEQYARLFPTRVRAMVLDGVVDPTQTGLQGAVDQAKGFSRALDTFMHSCDQNSCMGDRTTAVVIDTLLATVETAPIPSKGGLRAATPGTISLALAEGLYSQDLWPQLARAIELADSGNGSGIVRLADQYLNRSSDGTYPSGFEAYFAVGCLDSSWPKDPNVVFATAKATGSRYPRLGEAVVNDYVRCALWPVAPQPLKPITPALKGLPPTVVISTTGDPATPYASGVHVAASIPDARLITNVGQGHTVFAQGKACVDDAVSTYLVELKPPPNHLVCH